MASPFDTARTQHEALRAAAENTTFPAAPLWGAITMTGEPDLGTYADAVRATMPEEHVQLLVVDDVAACWAFARHHRKWSRTSETVLNDLRPFELRDMAREVWKEFDAKATQVQELAQGFGWDLSLAWRALSDLEAARLKVDDVRALARLAGRMYADLRGGRARRIPGLPVEVYSVEQGGDVGRLLPAELVQVCDPEFELAVLHRISTKSAAQYAMRGDAPASRGALVVAIDESGSMVGKRIQWARAAAIALARVAKDDRRGFSVVHFSTSTSVQHRIDPGDPAAIGKMLKTFLRGGTSLAVALSTAAGEVEQLAAKGTAGADVVIITDGIDEAEEAQAAALTAMAAKDVRCWLVAIDQQVPEGRVLRDRAAGYTFLDDSQMEQPNAPALAGAAA